MAGYETDKRTLFIRHLAVDRHLPRQLTELDGQNKHPMVYSYLTPINDFGFDKGMQLASYLSQLLESHRHTTGVHIDTVFLPPTTDRAINTVAVLEATGIVMREIEYIDAFAKDAWGPNIDPLFASKAKPETIDELRARRLAFTDKLGQLLVARAGWTAQAVKLLEEQEILDFDRLLQHHEKHYTSRQIDRTPDKAAHISAVRTVVREIEGVTPADQVIAYIGSGAELRFGIDELCNPTRQTPDQSVLTAELPLEWGEGYEIRTHAGVVTAVWRIIPDGGNDWLREVDPTGLSS